MISGFCVTFLSGGVLIARFKFNLIVLDEFACIWELINLSSLKFLVSESIAFPLFVNEYHGKSQ